MKPQPEVGDASLTQFEHKKPLLSQRCEPRIRFLSYFFVYLLKEQTTIFSLQSSANTWHHILQVLLQNFDTK